MRVARDLSSDSGQSGLFRRLLARASGFLPWGKGGTPELSEAIDQHRHDRSVLNDNGSLLSVAERQSEQNPRTLEPLQVELLRGWSVPVVGESFYENSFKQLHSRLKREPSGQFLESAEIRANPENSYSKSGKAVAVYVGGLQVGHIAEAIAPLVFDSLQQLGGRGKVGARVHLDTSSGSFRWSSVRLEMALPPRLSDNAANHKIDTIMFGPRFTDLGLFSADANAGSLISSLAVGEALVATVNLRLDGANVLICTVSGAPFLRPVNLKLSIDHSLFSSSQLAYLTAKIERVELGFAVGIQTTQDQKSVKVRTGDAISPVGNVLSSKFKLGLSPTGNWVKVRSVQFAASHSEIPSEFLPSERSPRVYFWAEVWPENKSLLTVWGFRASFYQKTIDSLRKQLDSLPNFLVLVRADFDAVKKKLNYEVDLDLGRAFIALPERPIVPANTLSGIRPRIVTSKSSPARAANPKPQPKPALAENVSKLLMLSGSLQTTRLDYLEDTYLLPCLQDIFNANRKEDSKAFTLVGGNTFNVDESSAAKDAARRGSPILTTSMVRLQLVDELATMPKYQALLRYENWFANQGLEDFGGWGFKLQSFDFTRGDIALIPGAALDERPMFDSASFSADLVGMSDSKEELSNLISGLGGTVFDTILIKGKLRFSNANSGLVVQVFKGELFLGRTPANQSASFAESARFYGLDEVWVRIDWTSKTRFKGAFSFFGER